MPKRRKKKAHKKNPIAVAMAKLRSKKMTRKARVASARKAGLASAEARRKLREQAELQQS